MKNLPINNIYQFYKKISSENRKRDQHFQFYDLIKLRQVAELPVFSLSTFLIVLPESSKHELRRLVEGTGA